MQSVSLLVIVAGFASQRKTILGIGLNWSGEMPTEDRAGFRYLNQPHIIVAPKLSSLQGRDMGCRIMGHPHESIRLRVAEAERFGPTGQDDSGRP